MNLPIPILSVLIGAIILFFGRKLFWLCVAAVGFAAGVEVAPQLVHEASPIVALIVAIVLGVIGAVLALLLQNVAIPVAGLAARANVAQPPVTPVFVRDPGAPAV